MKPASRKLLDKATRSIHAAQTLLDDGEAEFAAGRAYYAMFYAAEALLFERGLQYRKHSAVHAAFGEHLVRGGVVDSRFHRWLLDAFDLRILGDYGVDVPVDAEQAAELIRQATELLAEANRLSE